MQAQVNMLVGHCSLSCSGLTAAGNSLAHLPKCSFYQQSMGANPGHKQAGLLFVSPLTRVQPAGAGYQPNAIRAGDLVSSAMAKPSAALQSPDACLTAASSLASHSEGGSSDLGRTAIVHRDFRTFPTQLIFSKGATYIQHHFQQRR